MTSSNTQDLIIDGAELSCPITIKRGKTSRMYQVIAYPTQLTRKITNQCLDRTVTPDPKTIRKCRWQTAGIIRFHVNPETNSIYEVRPDLNELEITLECLLEEAHKEQLALRAEDMYDLEFSTDNFVICPFQTFMAQLTLRLSNGTKTLYGTLVDNKELYPMRVIFIVEDADELSEIASKLDRPRDHDIVLRYDYSLGGTSTARASLTISAEELNKIDLEKQIFGNSSSEKMLVSRSMMDKIAASVTTKLRVVEDIGVGGSSFGSDLIKQEIANAMSVSGFQKFSMNDIIQMQNSDTDITDDLKADIINSASSSNANSTSSSSHTVDQSSSADSTDMLHEKSNSTKRAGGQSSGSSGSSAYNANISIAGFGLGGGTSSSSSSQQATNFDNQDSSAKKDHEIVSTERSRLNENSGSNANSNSNSSSVQGQIRKVKNIDATLVHRSDITKGFTISLERWHHQLASTSIKGRLTTKTDVELIEEIQAKEEAERQKQERLEEEKRKAKHKAMRQESELSEQQIDDILHQIDSLDSDTLREMHSEFLELCPDGKMPREAFANSLQKVFPNGKTSNYCRYAFSKFDKDGSGSLNFTEYILAMHIHEMDDLEESLALAFNIFDYDKSGQIDQKEVLHMITATGELLGKPCETQTAKMLAKKIVDTCDKKRSGRVTQDEFIQGCKNNKEYCRILIPNFEQIAMVSDPNYEGDLELGKKHGKGVYTWPDGRRYEGQWNDDKQHGKGVCTWPDGRRYEGQWNDDKQHGKGVYTWPDGRRYEGDWKDDLKDGYGKETLPNGECYEGEWKDDKKNGKGVLNSSDGTRFEGNWKDDKKNGKGVFIWADGRRHETNWQDDKKQGKGVYTWPDGRKYEGELKNNLKDGYGKETSPDGECYEGEWKNDKKNGKGVQKFADGNKYDGEWKNNARHGQGIYIYKSGDKYTGQFNNDEFHGKGVYTWADGTQYEGDFKKDNFDGYGVRKYANGEQYKGQWKNDKRHGKGVLFLSNGNRFEGRWEDGERNPDGRLYCPSGMQWNGHITTELMNNQH